MESPRQSSSGPDLDGQVSNTQKQNNTHSEDVGFIVILAIISIAFAYLLAPYFGAVLWGVVAAIMFQPLTKKLTVRMNGHRNYATSIVLVGLVALIVVPTILLSIRIVNEASTLYTQLANGQIDLSRISQQLMNALPPRVRGMIDEIDLTNFDAIRRQFGSTLTTGLQSIAGSALTIGQSALSFVAALGVMLYLSFFLLRDGERYGKMVTSCLPLRTDTRDSLVQNFLLVVRATMRGTVVVAVVQGLLGGILFSILGIKAALIWGVLMGFFSLLPAVGTAVIWVPAAIYLFAIGSVGKAAIIVFCGVFIIGMVDNVLRPILVGRDTRMPDFVVLIATLAGLELFGLNGFIIGPVIAALFITIWNQMREHGEAEQERNRTASLSSSTLAKDSDETIAHPS